MKEIKHTVIRKGQKNSTNEHITLILELTREIRLWWNVQHEGKRFSVARISRIGVSSRNKNFCTAHQQINREFVNGLNSHNDPHRNCENPTHPPSRFCSHLAAADGARAHGSVGVGLDAASWPHGISAHDASQEMCDGPAELKCLIKCNHYYLAHQLN